MLFAQLSDPHVTTIPLQGVVDTRGAFERAVDAVLRFDGGLDAAVISGDLVERGDAADYALLKALIAPLQARMPVYLMAGNHDRREAVRAAFADHGYLRDAEFVQYAVRIGAGRLVACDSVVPGAGWGALCERRLAWLDRTLAEAPLVPTVVAVHHPPFACGIAFMDRLALRDGARELEATIARHPQVVRLICGHVHRAVTTSFGGKVAVIAPSTAHQIPVALDEAAPEQFVFEPPGWCLHRWDGTAMHSYVMAVDRIGAPVLYE